MPSLFDGTDKLICDAMGIQHRDHLNRKTLRNEPLSDDKAYSLVKGLIRRMMANFPGRPASQSKCALSFPAEFTCIPFADEREVKEICGNEMLSKEGGMVRDAFSKLEPVR